MTGLIARFRVAQEGFVLEAAVEAPARGVTALFGPSGAGKTTVLRCLAGLTRAADGYLELDGDCWQDESRGRFVPAHRRALGYVFQEASLFPHLRVRHNLAYGWKRVPRTQRRVALEQAAEFLGISALLDRLPATLSGGERQRVAMARALVTSPRMLLLDEPLANLDLRARAEILPYLESLRDELSIPVIYVSHSLDEVARLADHLVLIENGRVSASGRTSGVLARLDLPFFHGEEACAVVDAVVGGHDERFHLTHLEFSAGRIHVPRLARAPGQRVRLRIHARDVSLALERHEGSSILNVFPATVTGLAEAGPAQLLVGLDAAGTPLLARVTRKSGALLDLHCGKALFAQVKSVALLG